MIYDRSGTYMDDLSQFFPQSLLGVRGRRLGALRGDYDSILPAWGVDYGIQWPTEFATPGYFPEPAPVATSGGAFTPTGSVFSQLTQGLQQLLTVGAQAKAQDNLMRINLERAQRGLPPISGAAVAPQVQFGLTPATGVGLGTLALVGLGVYLLANSGKRARRRR